MRISLHYLQTVLQGKAKLKLVQYRGAPGIYVASHLPKAFCFKNLEVILLIYC